MNVAELIGLLASIVAIIGVVGNNRRAIWCFPLWWFSNAATLGLHLHAGMGSLAGRDAVFLMLAVHGFFVWRRSASRQIR